MTVQLPSLAHLAGDPRFFGGDERMDWKDYRHIIGQALAGAERTMQTEIGPSEIGTDCLLCLGRKLAGIPQRRGEDWLPFIGTAVHDALARMFDELRIMGERRFLVETQVDVGEIDGRQILGHADLYDIPTATVSDWKVVGVTTLRKVKAKGPAAAYQAQRHLYGRGFVRRGLPVERVRIIYLPRNEVNLANTIVLTEDYDESIALAALARADALAKAIRLAGWDAVAPNLPAAPGCFDCSRYPAADGTYPPAPGHQRRDEFAGVQ